MSRQTSFMALVQLDLCCDITSACCDIVSACSIEIMSRQFETMSRHFCLGQFFCFYYWNCLFFV